MPLWSQFPSHHSTRGTQIDPAWEEWSPLYLSLQTTAPSEVQSQSEYLLRLFAFHLASLTPTAILSDLVQVMYDFLLARGIIESAGATLPRSVIFSSAEVIAEQVAEAVSFARSIESIHVYQREWGFHCWLVANGSTEAERFAIYDVQWQFVEQQPDLVVKFDLVEREGQPVTELVTLDDADISIALHESENA